MHNAKGINFMKKTKIKISKREENAKRKKKLEALSIKMENSKNKSQSHFLYRREARIRFAMHFRNWTQKMVAKHLKISESYVTRLINGERYNRNFELWLRDFMSFDYFCI